MVVKPEYRKKILLPLLFLILLIIFFLYYKYQTREILKDFSDVRQDKSLLIDLVLVKGWKFIMGNDSSVQKDERPEHNVIISGFYMSKNEITVADFKRFVIETEYITDAEKYGGSWIHDGVIWKKKKKVNWKNPFIVQDEDHPVTCVSFYDAVNYCNWLSCKHGLTECYSIKKTKLHCDFTVNGFRLPTEAEWEYAAKGGRLADDFVFSGSNVITEVAWYLLNANKKSHPVGNKQANELGLFDMSGNVWEWCWDIYDKDFYIKSILINPKGSQKGKMRVFRGGSWFCPYNLMNMTNRFHAEPEYQNNMIGFRVVRKLDEN